MAWVLSLLLACDQGRPPPVITSAEPAPKPEVIAPKPAEPMAPKPPATSTRRVVAIGDVHGDWDATRKALKLAGLIDDGGHWSGGTTLAVQVGDQLDRGDQEQAILDGLEALQGEARKAGGELIVILGNHEIMNASGDLRYVTPGGFADFASIPFDASQPKIAAAPPEQRGRIAAFQPGGPYARKLASHPVVAVVEGVAFVHGGLRETHATYGVDKINREAQAFLVGDGPLPGVLDGPTAPTWDRTYGMDPDAAACAELDRTLAAVGARRMIVAHTVQEKGITNACDGKVWRVDVGLARHYGGPTQALEIIGDQVKVLGAAP